MVERGRGPDPPGARVEVVAAVGSVPLAAAAVHESRQPERESRRGGAEENLPLDARAVVAANHHPANPVAVHRAGNRAAAKAAEEVEVERPADGRVEAAVAVLVVEHSLPWLG